MRRTEPIKEIENEGLVLYRFYDSGKIKWCRIDPGHMAARRMDETDPLNVTSMAEMNRRVIQASNDFLGSLAGKTILIFGTGPQLKRINFNLAYYLAKHPDTFLIGINAAPIICQKIWGAPPDEIFDLLVASDVVVRKHFRKWAWDQCPNVKRYCFWRHFDRINHPILRHESEPTGHVQKVYGHTSIISAIHIALAGLATETDRTETIHKATRALEGRIILLGIEENRHDHAFSGHPEIQLPDNPGKPWPVKPIKRAQHGITSRYSKTLDAYIFNSAPWSDIRNYHFCNIEEVLDIPERLRTGLSLKEPEHASTD